MEPDVVLMGGGGEDAGLVLAIGEALGTRILVPEQPRVSTAYGAACLAELDLALQKAGALDNREEGINANLYSSLPE